MDLLKVSTNKYIGVIVDLKFKMIYENSDLYVDILNDASKKKVIDKYEKLYNENKVTHFIVKINEEIIGSIGCFTINDNIPYFYYDENYKIGFIGDFFVKKEHRRKGIGSLLIKEAEKYFKSNNFKKLEYETTKFSKNILTIDKNLICSTTIQ